MLTEIISIPDSVRLRYRMMDGRDADLLFELDQDPVVMHFLNDGKPTPREEIDEYFVPRIEAFTDPTTGCGLWAVNDKDSGDYLGWILVRQYGFGLSYVEPDNIELGWRLKRHCWGQGIATEAAQAIVDVLRLNPDVLKFSALTDSENFASTRVMEKLGMEFVDSRTHHTPKKDVPVDYYEMEVWGQ